MTRTLEDLAVVGRRYAGMNREFPGIITSVSLGVAEIRLDGHRSTILIPVDSDNLAFLNEVVPVPELPMGFFQPSVDHANGFWEWAGVVLAVIGEDGDELLLMTDDPGKAVAAASAFFVEEALVEVKDVDFGLLEARWAVFEWQPENAECPWLVNWDAAEGDDHAIHIHYLPA
jgi:hypothetical protein